MDLQLQYVGAALAALGVTGGGISIGIIGKSMLEALARNPEVGKKALIYGILAMALAEATAIYAFVVAILIVSK